MMSGVRRQYARGGHRVVVVLEGQSLKRHVLQIRRHQNLGELRNDHRIGVRILARIGQISEGPRSRRAIQEPLPRLREFVLNVLDQIAMVGDEAVRGRMVRFSRGRAGQVNNLVALCPRN